MPYKLTDFPLRNPSLYLLPKIMALPNASTFGVDNLLKLVELGHQHGSELVGYVDFFQVNVSGIDNQ